MAELSNSLIPQQQEEKKTLSNLLESANVKARLEQVLGRRASQFASSIISVVNGNAQLKSAEPQSILTSAMKAAVLDLPIDNNLGFAYLVPYKKECTLQLGYKGFIQLALRSGQYKNINVIDIRAGELKSFNRLTEEIEINFIDDDDEREKLDVIGYAAFFKLVNGFSKTIYWSREKVDAHAKAYSASYRKYGDGLWRDKFDDMAKKTVVKTMLSKWGILSIDMQTAIKVDQAVIDESGEPVYPDNPQFDIDDIPTIEPEAKTEANIPNNDNEVF